MSSFVDVGTAKDVSFHRSVLMYGEVITVEMFCYRLRLNGLCLPGASGPFMEFLTAFDV